LGKKGNPRDWIFIELGNKWYVRDAKWKLNRADELYDMSNAPFNEKLVLASSDNAESAAARKKLTEILAQMTLPSWVLPIQANVSLSNFSGNISSVRINDYPSSPASSSLLGLDSMCKTWVLFSGYSAP
jgi:hypothetical protein